MKAYASIDKVGLSLSALCVVHCLFLPLLGTVLPLLGTLSEIEWLHKILVVLALPVALNLIFSQSRYQIRVTAIFGLLFLLGAAFIPQLHDIETVITVLGALILGSSHLLRLSSKGHSHRNK